jgi:3-dehydroquinate synthetase
MIESLNFSIKSVQQVEFVIDNDPDFNWLSTFDSKEFNRIFVVIDNYVNERWNNTLLEKLENHQKEIRWLLFESVEKNKSLESYVHFIKKLEEEGINRFDVLVVIGSGVLLDLLGFVASTYMRGVPLIFVPTTLIGQVDAATAGKTCVNSMKSKNLVGSLYFARFVYNNIRFLDSLSSYHFRQGLSEIFKYGLLGSSRLLDYIECYASERSDRVIIDIIKETINVRIKIRKIDPLASNLGHTFGHAFEKVSNYQIGHGDAISLGIIMALRFSVEQGIIKNKTVEDVEIMMKRLGLNLCFDPEWSVDEIVSLMAKDKKSSSKKINLILIKDIGNPYSCKSSPFYPVEKEIIADFLHSFFDKYTHYSKPGICDYLKSKRND